jgi:hypothetical protein
MIAGELPLAPAAEGFGKEFEICRRSANKPHQHANLLMTFDRKTFGYLI